MLFNSYEFLIFFPVVTALYFLLPHRLRWGLLLLASCVFYMAFIPIYILILAVTIVIDYAAGILIEKSSGRSRRRYLIVSIVSTCLVLFVFKYFGFFNEGLAVLANALGLHYPENVVNIILPIGLSFHTFQSLSYVIEVYRGKQKAEKHFGIYALYVMFYPQLVAGPIERPQNLLHQLRERHSFDWDRIAGGLRLMLWGLFKKVVIADRLAVFVDQVYGRPEAHSGLGLVLGTVFFAVQIFCDFSGYSDIAIGAAQVMGIRLMTNFRRPYSARSMAEFWKRWHISLSTWFRDYLYIPLGGSRVPKWRWQLNLLIVFLVSGLWHGAAWTFVIWGGLNGLYLLVSHWSRVPREALLRLTRLDRHAKVHGALSMVFIFAIVCVGWVFFRAADLGSALYIIRHFFSGWEPTVGYVTTTLQRMGLTGFDILALVISIGFLELVHFTQRAEEDRRLFGRAPTVVRWAGVYALVLSIVVMGVFTNNQFIYFQF